MDMRQAGLLVRVRIGWGSASAVMLLTLWVLPDVAGGGNVSSQREVQRLASGERNLVELGRRLFFDPALSGQGKNACASCHEPEHGFGDSRRFSKEDVGRTQRHSQSLIDVDLKANQHWDGEFLSVSALVEHRTTQTGTPQGYGGEGKTTPGRRSPRVGVPERVFTLDEEADESLGSELTPECDLGLPDGLGVSIDGFGSVRVRTQRIGRGFQGEQFGSPPDPDANGAERVLAHERYVEALAAVQSERRPARFDAALAGKAIEAYVGSLRSNRSAYDRYRAGEVEALSASAERGLQLFRGRAGCVACHKEEGPKGWPVFRDGDFHNNGIAWLSDRVALEIPAVGSNSPIVTPGPLLDEGRGRFLLEGAAQRAFKTPSLRDVARHPPYMHDGSKATLDDVVAHYAAGCGDDPARDERLRGFVASDQDRRDLVAFLTALTSEERPGRATEAWQKRAERTTVRFLDARGEPVVGFAVGLEEAGDKVPLERAVQLPPTVETDRRGEIVYLVPGSTHVRLLLPRGMEPEGGTLVPDTCKSAQIVLPLSGKVRLALVVDDPALATPDTLRAYEPIDLPQFITGQERSFRAAPWTLARKGDLALGTQRAVLYEGYRLGAGHRSLVFRLPGQSAPQEIALAPDGPEGSTSTTQRVDVAREGSESWRALAQQATEDATR